MKNKKYKLTTVNDLIHDERIFPEVSRNDVSHRIKDSETIPGGPKYRSMSHFIETVVSDFLNFLDGYPSLKEFDVYQRGITLDGEIYDRCKEYVGNSMRSLSDIVRLARIFYLMRRDNGQLS